MDELTRVTFRFERAMEVRYVARAPVPGDFVTHGDEPWVVVQISVDEVGLVAECERDRRPH